ncbi:MAG TPA: homoserine O-succinyltransferase [Hellea balneolensis]|uniref:Homoserine O-succinyltransferase n=1 Tax=Hellea balneolensis TaxID=287478 RepID=A0A7C5M1H8_9PROT|nr:homoserine O-succinyltransferase [Hellea balneolensis]
MARDIEVKLGETRLERGDVLKDDCIIGRLYGTPGKPVIVIPGGISASRFVADNEENGHGWWKDIVYRGGPIDLNRYQVLGLDLAPTGANVKNRVAITTHDQAKRIIPLLDHLGLTRIEAMIGMSYGGMVALAFSELFPDRINKLLVLGAAHRPFPMGVAIRGIQRRIIELAAKTGQAEDGLKLARELAMTTYRSAEEFSERFNAEPIGDTNISFDVGEYLQACGRKYPGIMPVNRFLALSESIDLHRIDPAKITAPTTLIATRSDQLAPPHEMQAMADKLGGPCELITIESIFGHDSFLKEIGVLSDILKDFTKGKRRAA